MKRNKRKAKQKAAKAVPQQPIAPQAKSGPSRRALFQKLGTGAVAAAVVGGLGWYLVDDVQATIREEDLSRIGQGTPVVVQIHDPQCSRCVALQREARSAMGGFDKEELQFLVANIRTPEGRSLANRHDVGNVTLLLFDGNGTLRNTLVGNRESDALEKIFKRIAKRSGA